MAFKQCRHFGKSCKKGGRTAGVALSQTFVACNVLRTTDVLRNVVDLLHTSALTLVAPVPVTSILSKTAHGLRRLWRWQRDDDLNVTCKRKLFNWTSNKTVVFSHLLKVCCETSHSLQNEVGSVEIRCHRYVKQLDDRGRWALDGNKLRNLKTMPISQI